MISISIDTVLALVIVVATCGKLGYSGSDNDESGRKADGEPAAVPAHGPGAADRGGVPQVVRRT